MFPYIGQSKPAKLLNAALVVTSVYCGAIFTECTSVVSTADIAAKVVLAPPT